MALKESELIMIGTIILLGILVINYLGKKKIMKDSRYKIPELVTDNDFSKVKCVPAINCIQCLNVIGNNKECLCCGINKQNPHHANEEHCHEHDHSHAYSHKHEVNIHKEISITPLLIVTLMITWGLTKILRYYE